MYSFLLVDDHSIIRTGLKILIEKEHFNALIDEAIDGESAMAAIKSYNYNLVILDINMPDTDPVNLISNIRILRPDIKILLFSMNSEIVFAKKYFKLGVNGYLHKEAPNEEIKDAIRVVLMNGKYLSPGFKQHLSNEALNGIKETPFARLSSREFEVALLLIQGKGVTEISKFLNLHTSSIATYKGKIFEKCQVDNILDLYTLAKANGVV